MHLIQIIKEEFPDIHEADIVRVLSFLNYTADDMFNDPPPYNEIKGITYYLPWEVERKSCSCNLIGS